jgi:hypothetical protein
MPVPKLRDSGLVSRSISLGVPLGETPELTIPLQLQVPLTNSDFATTLAGSRQRGLPAGAVIDWSVDWFSEAELRRIEERTDGFFPDLTSPPPGPMLLVGLAGTAREKIPDPRLDVSRVPLAVQDNPTYARWKEATAASIPNALVQAVLARSIASGHWLQPLHVLAVTPLAAGLGVVLAAIEARTGRRLLLLLITVMAAVPASLQLAVSFRALAPLVIPLGALAATTLVRRENPRWRGRNLSWWD